MGEQQYPEPTVGVLIFNSRGEILLVKSHKWRGKYVVPGGHIELGETAVEAACREAKEETGLEISDVQFLCWQECIYDRSFWKARHFIFLDFTAHTNDGRVILNDEAQDFVWTDPGLAIEQLEIDSYTSASIQEYMRHRAKAV